MCRPTLFLQQFFGACLPACTAAFRGRMHSMHSGAAGLTVTVTGYKIFQGLTCLKYPSTLKNPYMEAELICKLC